MNDFFIKKDVKKVDFNLKINKNFKSRLHKDTSFLEDIETIDYSVSSTSWLDGYKDMSVDEWLLEKQNSYDYFFLKNLVAANPECDSVVLEQYLNALIKGNVNLLNIKSINGNEFTYRNGNKITLSGGYGDVYIKTLEIEGEKFFLDSEGNIVTSSLKSIYNNLLFNGYGGSQTRFSLDDCLEDEQIMEILEENFPGATSEEYSLYLDKLSEVGCGYTALVNCLLQEYISDSNISGQSEFLKKFGFSLYEFDPNYGSIDLKYKSLIVDFYTWYWKEQEGYSDISDIIDKSEGSDGGAMDAFGVYLKDKYDVSIDIEKSFVELGMLSLKTKFGKKSNIENALKSGKQVIVSAVDYDLYYTPNNFYGMEGGELAFSLTDAPHGMTVTGIAEDGRLIVSSWGEEFTMDVSDIQNFIFVDINW